MRQGTPSPLSSECEQTAVDGPRTHRHWRAEHGGPASRGLPVETPGLLGGGILGGGVGCPAGRGRPVALPARLCREVDARRHRIVAELLQHASLTLPDRLTREAPHRRCDVVILSRPVHRLVPRMPTPRAQRVDIGLPRHRGERVVCAPHARFASPKKHAHRQTVRGGRLERQSCGYRLRAREAADEKGTVTASPC